MQSMSSNPALSNLLPLALLLAGAAVAYWLGRKVLLRLARRLAKSTANTWDDALIRRKVVSRLTQLLPVFVIYMGVDLLPSIEDNIESLLLRFTSVYMIMVITFVLTGALGAVNDIYESHPRLRQRPLKGFLQLAQMVQVVFGLLLSISVLMDRSPWILLSGFGAMTAVLLLVFKDTILSLVASVQLTAHDLVRVGDWIEVSAYGVDGDVIGADLHTIRVQNWDNTITTIPTHVLVGDSFKNWRGMYQSGGRRIKRCLSLDANSVRFLSDAEVARFKRFALLKDYVETKREELQAYNEGVAQAHGDDGNGDAASAAAPAPERAVNLRRLTNIGTFRAYIYNYLKHHPRIHQSGMTLLVRQLPVSPEGVPIEIYCFTNTTDWVEYEGIQGDIFDHLLAIVGEFGLRLYQQPGGADFAAGLSSRV